MTDSMSSFTGSDEVWLVTFTKQVESNRCIYLQNAQEFFGDRNVAHGFANSVGGQVYRLEREVL